MSTVIVNVLCEGPTEDLFAKAVLKEYLQQFGIVVKPIILTTSKKKQTKGGMINYLKVKNDLILLIKQHSAKTYEKHFFTTMFDLYALPNDFPGYDEAKKISDCYQKVKKLEEKLAEDTPSENFIPYIQLHEFEALVFCGLEHLLVDYPDMKKQVEELKKALDTTGNPEKINSSPETAPSKRIIKAFEKFHNYDKPKSGAFVTGKVGIETLKSKCTHFKEWMEKLEKLVLH